jgi:hypothetical protein
MRGRGLTASLARLEDDRCTQSDWDNSKRTREFYRCGRLQSIQPVMRACADHGGNVVDGNASPRAKSDLGKPKCVTYNRKQIERGRI